MNASYVPKSPSWQTIGRMEQSRWLRFARAHAHEHERCADVAARGHVEQRDAVELAAIARERGWQLARAGQPAAPQRRRRR